MDTTPTQAGFNTWVYSTMGVTTAQLPTNSSALVYAFTVAQAIVNPGMNIVNPTIYALAVYNLGGDNLVNWAQDQLGQNFWSGLRQSFGIGNFTGGVVSSAGDEGTSSSLEIVESLKNLTIGQLQNLKTPYGRQYLAFAMSAGTDWGVS